MVIVPEPEVARLAGLYLKVVIAGAPGYAAFEAGKRYTQAQGLFSASLYVLLFCAPFNAFMNWLFVWQLEMGFVGAPLAVAITDNLLPIGLFIYVRFFSKSGMSCWNGFTKKAFQNWGPMVKLALPGVVMIEAEVLAFEILTFASSYFGTTVLAAQSVLATLTSITFQIPFPLSIAGSTRVANLIGATLADAGKVSMKVTFSAAVVVGVLNVTLLSTLKDYIPRLFTSDPEVVRIVSEILPLCAAFQLFDALAAACNGILRGLGRQEFGGYVQLFCYYVFAMPISFGLAFGKHWGLWGLWTGVALALGLVALIEFIYLSRTDWQRSVEEARARNQEGGVM
jgi:MATE family multidrug resistance protein